MNGFQETNWSVWMPKYKIVLDPPIGAKEFGEWSGDPNIALKDKHDYVEIEAECSAEESMTWFHNLVQEYTILVDNSNDEQEVPRIPEEHLSRLLKNQEPMSFKERQLVDEIRRLRQAIDNG